MRSVYQGIFLSCVNRVACGSPVSAVLFGAWLSVVVPGAPALAETIIVYPGESIQTAINNANSGDTVLVKSGTYNNGVEITKDNIKLVSDVVGGAHIISYGQPAIQAYNQHNIVVTGFRLTAQNDSDGVKIGGSPGANSTNITFNSNTVETAGKDGLKFFHINNLAMSGNRIKTAGLLRNSNGDGGIDWVDVNYSSINSNVVEHTYGHACFMMKGGSHYNFVSNNLFLNCERDGMTVGGKTSGAAAISVNQSGWENHHNTITNNTIQGGKNKCAFYFVRETANTLYGNNLIDGGKGCSTRGGGGSGSTITE